MSPVPGAAPAPKDPIGRLKENPKSKLRQDKVSAAIASGGVKVRELEPLLVGRDKDAVRAAVLIGSKADKVEPILVETKLLPHIEDSNKRAAIAVVGHLAHLGAKDREAAVFALGDTALARHVTELFEARPRDLKEALGGDDKLRARVAVAAIIGRGDKGEALLYEARSSKDRVVSGAALAALRALFVSGELQPRAKLDSLWLKQARFRA